MATFEDRKRAHGGHAPAHAAATEAPVGRATPTEQHAPAPDDPNGSERIYGDQHHDQHARRYEPHHAHAERMAPKVDDYNKKTIDDHASKYVAGRPGVVSQGHGLFTINKPEVTRYTFVRQGKRNVAVPFDVIEHDKLTTVNWKAAGQHAPKDGKDTRLLVNPANPRHLFIHGRAQLCVLTWAGGASAAWMRVADLVHGHRIAEAAHSRAHHEDPDATSHDPDKLLHQTERYVIRNDKVGEAGPSDKPHGKDKVVGPGQKSGDDLPHYLVKDLRKPAFDAGGHATKQNVTRSLVALCMNLPEGDTPPIAIDTLLAGESFYMMKDSSFHRESPLYLNGQRHTNVLEKWVFGYVGMRDEHGHVRPDPTRRGWVPFRVLAVAKDLETHEVAQRPSNG